MIAGSTFTSTCTSLPVTALSASLMRGEMRVARRLGDGHLGGDLALVAGDQRAEARIMSRTANSRRFAATTLRKLRREPADAGLVEDRR